jgi:hypothetical protein
MGSMAALVLSATMAAGVSPADAWKKPAVWSAAPSVELAGVAGAGAAPARVRALWNDDWLLVEFICRDAVIVSPGKEDDLDHFLLGDVVEVFVARAGRSAYAEFHATPRGRQSRYFFGDYRRPGPRPAAAGRVVVKAGQVDGGWRAVFGLPWEALGGSPGDDRWEIFAARYDYDEAGGGKVLSSWPAQEAPADFHRRADYGTLELGR